MHHDAYSGRELPGVTIVVACFNHREFVREALDSVFSQEYPRVHVILTDDASIDGTQEEIRELLDAQGWTANTIFHAANRGLCATLNEALAQVSTPYVAFMSADDWSHTRRITTQVSVLEEDPSAALVFGPVIMVDEDGSMMERQWRDFFPDEWPGHRTRNVFLELLRGNWIPAPSVLSRTAALREVGGFDESLPFEDWDMWLRLARTRPFQYCEESLVYYRQHASSMWSGLRSPSGLLQLRLTEIDIYRKHRGYSPESDRIIAELIYRSSIEAWKLGADTSLVKPHLRAFALSNGGFLPWCYWLLASCRVRGSRLIELRHRLRTPRNGQWSSRESPRSP